MKNEKINTVEKRKEDIKRELINMNYFKTPDGKQLYELSLVELERIYHRLNCIKARSQPISNMQKGLYYIIPIVNTTTKKRCQCGRAV